ncbi:MAG: response regulator [candidate division KSB1 bacterium]
MDRKKIILVDKEPQALTELRRALLTAGYEVRIVFRAAEALALAENFRPNLIMAESRLPEMDGPRLLEEVRNRPDLQSVPFVLMGKLKTVEERLALMKLPLDDYFQKPFEVEEAVVRLENLIKEVEQRAHAPRPNWRGFNGALSEMNLFDLLQTISVGKKTCVLKLQTRGKTGTVYLLEGEVIDAELDGVEARRALLRMFTWTEGSFQVELRPHERGRLLTTPTHDLLSEGLTRQDRWARLLKQMPSLQSLVRLKPPTQTAVLNQEERGLLERIAATRAEKSLLEIVEENPGDELRTLTVLKRLHDQGLLTATAMAASVEKSNGDYFARLKQWREHGGDVTLITRLEHLLVAQEEPAPRAQDRRRLGRRLGDRRQHDRRSGFKNKEETPLFLKKSELLMLREKLARE